MSGETNSDIRMNLNISQTRELNKILLDHSKINNETPTDTTSDRSDPLSKSYNEIQSFDSCLMNSPKNHHYNIKSMDENSTDLNRKMMTCDRKIRNHLSQLNDKMANIKRSILNANIILDRITETSSLCRRKFAKKLQIINLIESRAQNFVEIKRELPIFLSTINDSTNTEDFNIPDKSLDNVFTGIRTGSLPPWASNIIVRDYDDINSILGDNDTIESLSDSYPDFISRNVSLCGSEAPSLLSFKSLSCENSKYDSDSDDVFITKDDEGLIYFDAKDFELDINNEQELPDNFEEQSITDSENMSETNELWINDVELKGEKRLFDTFNEYLGTDKLYSENLHVEYESETLCTLGFYKNKCSLVPYTLIEVSYKIIWNNDIGEYLLVFEEQGPIKSKFIVRINNNLGIRIFFFRDIICKYSGENQSTKGSIKWNVEFRDGVDMCKFRSLVDFFRMNVD
uniref:Uncharacterized protein n=1 Tax=Strongyloides papillosus TaxID=174720 RepID=A0A0N5BPK2_STREA